MKLRLLCFTAACALFNAGVHADEGGPWVVKVGVHTVDPKSDNGTLAGGSLKADAGSDTEPTVTAEYMFDANWGVELLASWPWEHEVKLNGARAASTKQLPPTLSAQYHFNPGGAVSPFVGVGLNYTIFYDEHETGPLAGTHLSVGNSLGAALHGGFDVRLADRWRLTVDARWIDIDSQIRVNGAKVGTVHIDPLVYGVAIGYRF